mmetsp:Transcript_63946/g.106327  ORF Transcript_63946/g.106327 Transcript_63946/m.106327 type:complete len:411 (+) Transcript_63946:3-1235(+)
MRTSNSLMDGPHLPSKAPSDTYNFASEIPKAPSENAMCRSRVSVAEMVARLANRMDLPLEHSNEVEEAQLAAMRTALLASDGSPPIHWRAGLYTRCFLRTFWREHGQRGIQHACSQLQIAIKFMAKEVIPGALAYEGCSEAAKRLWDRWTPGGFFGHCKRGASVMYLRMAQEDKGGMVDETSFQVGMQREYYLTLQFWDTLYRDSLEVGISLDGVIFVLDMACTFDRWSVRRFWRALRFAQRMASVYPNNEPPLPHGVRTIIVRNIPTAFAWALPPMSRLLPRSDRSKVYLFAVGQEQAFRRALFDRVDSAQVPRCFGGESEASWPFGAGGDVPMGSLEREADAIAQECTRNKISEQLAQHSLPSEHMMHLKSVHTPAFSFDAVASSLQLGMHRLLVAATACVHPKSSAC